MKSSGSSPANVSPVICSGPVPVLVTVSVDGCESVCIGCVPGKLKPGAGLNPSVATNGVIVTSPAACVAVSIEVPVATGLM